MLQWFRDLRVGLSDKRIIHFYAVMFFWALAEGVVIFYMPIFIESKISDLVLVGIFVGLNSFFSVVADIIFGFVSDITDYRKFFYIGIGLCLCLIPLFLLSDNWVWILLLVIVWGFEYELFWKFGSAVFIAKHAPHKQYEVFSGTNFLIVSIAMFIGPILADYFLGVSEQLLIAFLLVVYVVTAVYTWVRFKGDLEPYKHAQDKLGNLTIASELQILRKHGRKVMPFLILGFGLASYESVFLVFGSIAFTKSTEIAGLLLAIPSLAYVVTPIVAVSVVKRVRPEVTVLLGGLAVLVAAFAEGYLSDQYLLLAVLFVAFAALTFLFIQRDALFLAMLGKIKASEEDELVCISSLGPNVSYIILAVAGGILMQVASFEKAVLFSGVLLVFCILVFIFLYRRDNRRVTQKMYS